jgi:hypothetical protein
MVLRSRKPFAEGGGVVYRAVCVDPDVVEGRPVHALERQAGIGELAGETAAHGIGDLVEEGVEPGRDLAGQPRPGPGRGCGEVGDAREEVIAGQNP